MFLRVTRAWSGPVLFRYAIIRGLTRIGYVAGSVFGPVLPVSGKSMEEVPLPFVNGWNWICNTSITGLCGSILKFLPRPFPLFWEGLVRLEREIHSSFSVGNECRKCSMEAKRW